GWMRDDSVQYGVQTLIAYPSAGRCHQAEYHACNRGVDTRGIHCEPSEAANKEVERKTADAYHSHHANDSNAERSQGERTPCDVTAVADGDDENRTDVVHDCQREHKNAK